MRIGESFKIHHAWLLWSPWAAFVVGYAMNIAVVAANHGQMPVLVPPGLVIDPNDFIHTTLVPASHLKFLADWIFSRTAGGVNMSSPGDFFQILGDTFFGPFLGAWCGLNWHTKKKEQWNPHPFFGK